MKVLISDSIAGFAELGLPWASRAPVVNNVLTTNAEAARDGRQRFDDALWITVLNGAEVVGTAMHTPPYHLFVCPMPARAARALAESLFEVRPELSGVSGEATTAGDFVEAWQRLTAATAVRSTSSRLYALSAVTAPSHVDGELREGAPADHALLVEWTTAFLVEAVPGDPHDDVAASVDRTIASRGYYLWEVDGRPVCYAAIRPPAAGVARIGPVYTPPAHRRCGYAGACVAAVSQRTLDAGAQQCALYADLANPTSNGVYQRLGYRPVGDSEEYAFSC